jgi:ABC-type antimicrobial peptide transport system permease subunit
MALLMVAIGLYGLLAATVAGRTREIGIRIALGAQRGEIVWLVVARGLAATAIGMMSGVALGLALSRYVKSQLFGIEPGDVPTIVGVVTLFFVVAIAAVFVPARRAARISPTASLSHE